MPDFTGMEEEKHHEPDEELALRVLELGLKYRGDLEKTLVTLSSGALVLSPTLILRGPQLLKNLYLFYLAEISFIISVISVIILFIAAIRNAFLGADFIDSPAENAEKRIKAKRLGKARDFLLYLSVITFIVGLLLLTIFFFTNIHQEHSLGRYSGGTLLNVRLSYPLQ